MRLKTLFLVLLCSVCTFPVRAQVTLPSFFSDNMVLQRDCPIHLWGWAGADEKIEIHFKRQIRKTIATNDGNWSTYLDASAYGGPYTLVVKGEQSEVEFNNVLIGDVWLCSGQSNMEFHLNDANNAMAEISGADYPGIRLFTVGRATGNHPKMDVGGTWHSCSPSTAGDFSAVGYFFGKEIHSNTHIPIGLICSSWGGTVAETWTSPDGIRDIPEFTQKLSESGKIDMDSFEQTNLTRKAAFEKALNADPGIAEKWYATGSSPTFDGSMCLPQAWSGTALTDMNGTVWFFIEITLSDNPVGKQAVLSLGRIDDADITWINGVEVGRTTGYQKERLYAFDTGILKKGKNVITISVSDYSGEGGFSGQRDQLYLEIGGTKLPLAKEWKYKVAVDSRKYGYVEFGPNAYPSLLYNGMIAPLTGLPIRGVIWYQGESNDYNPTLYRTLFPNLINDWRARWNNEFSFYWVQLANYRSIDKMPQDSKWAEIREAQTQALSLPKTGQAVTIDIGEADDIHPKNKKDVGKRLALHALKLDYGKKNIVADGPTFRSMKTKKNKIIISFDNAGSGLVSKDGNEFINGFAIAGKDNKFVWAKAKICGNVVIVWNDTLLHPVAVRYGWSDNPGQLNLYNKEGLPATPFRMESP